MNYGSTTTQDGQPLIAPKVLAGLRVKDNKLVSFDFSKDQNGNTVSNRVTIAFEQSNGYMFMQSFLDSDLDWAVEKLNRDILHICTKIVTTEEYNSIVAGSTNFVDFMTRVRDKIMIPNYGKMFNLKITYGKPNKVSGRSYAGFPNIPQYIEPADTPDENTLFKDDPRYDFYTPVTPVATTAPTATSEEEPLF